MNTFLLLLLAVSADPVATMRIDYLHSGSRTSELFALEQVVVEALPFPGNLERPVDATLRGKYLFEIVGGDGEIAWSRSFSSIYGEWETTAEARQIQRSFHESVRFPAQDKPFTLVIKKRDARNDFQPVWRLPVDPADVLVHHESAPYVDEVVAIRQSGKPGSKVDLLLLGDGYTAGETEAFIERARELTAALFATSPFKERAEDFNVWALAPVSRQSGISRPSTGIYRDTPLGTTYDAFRSERYVLTFDNKSLRRVASSAPYDFIEILTNTETYGGGGIYGLYSTAAANSRWAEYLFIHEFGHHFAGLADEYYTSSVAYEPSDITVEPYAPNVTALLNPDELKWKHLVLPSTPIPTPWPKQEYERHSVAVQARRWKMREDDVPERDMDALFKDSKDHTDSLFAAAPHNGKIGAFEGANYSARGYYRSEQNCLMFTRSATFCRVCADAIEAVIDEYVLPAVKTDHR
ncbi:MAG: M64 family metallopeptidase [Pseudomonadota bacterium]